MNTTDIIVHPTNEEQVVALKAFMKALKIDFELTKRSPYNTEFVKKITKSRKDCQEGKVIAINFDNLESLWK